MTDPLWDEEEELLPGVQELKFNDPERLIATLRREAAIWGPREWKDWIFRGHADATWKLLPTVHRSEVWRQWMQFPQPEDLRGMSESKRIWCEESLITGFETAANNAGLPLPLYRSERPRHWPFFHDVATLALAQHSGIPTRLLDWSRSGTVAAYFAAAPTAYAEFEPENLAIWAINKGFLEGFFGRLPGVACDIVEAPRAANPNLHAQDGVFTCTKFNDSDAESTSRFGPLEQLVPAAAALCAPEVLAVWGKYPLKKLTLPRALAPELLRLLHADRFSAVRLYPDLGFASVARHVKERIYAKEG